MFTIGAVLQHKHERLAKQHKVDLVKRLSCEETFAFADAAGRAKAAQHTPTPMIVVGYEDQPVMREACGFAWVPEKTCYPTGKETKYINVYALMQLHLI